jgi:hypothetical protein
VRIDLPASLRHNPLSFIDPGQWVLLWVKEEEHPWSGVILQWGGAVALLRVMFHAVALPEEHERLPGAAGQSSFVRRILVPLELVETAIEHAPSEMEAATMAAYLAAWENAE